MTYEIWHAPSNNLIACCDTLDDALEWVRTTADKLAIGLSDECLVIEVDEHENHRVVREANEDAVRRWRATERGEA